MTRHRATRLEPNLDRQQLAVGVATGLEKCEVLAGSPIVEVLDGGWCRHALMGRSRRRWARWSRPRSTPEIIATQALR